MVSMFSRLALCLAMLAPAAGLAATPPPTKVQVAPRAATPKTAAKTTTRTHTITAKDYFSVNYVWSVAISPKGDQVVYGEPRWGKKSRNSDLWLVNTKTRRRTRLTFHKARDGGAQWGVAGHWIYFLSRREATKGEPTRGKRQVWRIRPSGERLMPVTRAPKGVASFQIGRSGKRLFYQTNKRKVQKGPFYKLRKRFPKLKYGHNATRQGRIWSLDLETWHTRLLHKSKRSINFFAVSPDETRIAMLTAPDRKLITNEGWSRVDIYDIKTRKIHQPNPQQWRKRAPSPYGWLSNLRWASDSKMLSFRVSFDGYPAEVYVLALEGTKVKTSTMLKRQDQAHFSYNMGWQPNSHNFCYSADHRGMIRLYCASFAGGRQGKTARIPLQGSSAWGFSFNADGKQMAISLNGQKFPSDVFVGAMAGEKTKLRRITRLNPHVDTWKLPNTSIAKWKSTDGTAVEGILELPHGVTGKPKKPLPLLVILHGGPTASSKRTFRFGYQGRTLYAARGWATLSPNYRGSTGFGDKFLVDLIGHKNNRDIADILSGVDALVKRGIADPTKMAIVGWSNGGYLVNCLITQTTRFKAASSGAGVFDTAMQWMIEDTPGHVINYSRGLPWKRRREMAKSSPLYHIHKAKTPTIIHVGERDARVPVEHSRGLYRSLKRYLNVPTQLIVYPGVYHGLRSRKHRSAKIKWDMSWFDHYVLRKPPKKPQPRKRPTPPQPKPPKGIKAS